MAALGRAVAEGTGTAEANPDAHWMPAARQGLAAGWIGRPRLSRVAEAVESEVVPRLLLARGAGLVPAVLVAPLEVEAMDVTALCGLLLVNDAAAAVAYVEDLHLRGLPLERLYLDLLAPAARQLGQYWVDDVCDFGTVTIGLIRLHDMLRDYGPTFLRNAPKPDARRRILLMPVPGEQHTFGLDMVAQFFRRAGWEVRSLVLGSYADATRAVRKDWFAVAGFSVGSAGLLQPLAGGIRAVRHASRNHAIGVMVGGPAFLEHPDYVTLVGADALSGDAALAPAQAERLTHLMAQRASA